MRDYRIEWIIMMEDEGEKKKHTKKQTARKSKIELIEGIEGFSSYMNENLFIYTYRVGHRSCTSGSQSPSRS